MYGYIRPNKAELRVREYESFRGVYCGLCHELRRRYGPACRFLVNYDFTFLAMLLAQAEDKPARLCRCPYHPLRRKTVCMGACESLATAADYTVILAYWKLRDGMTDKKFFGRVGCGLACGILRHSYKKASDRKPEFARITAQRLDDLARLETEQCPRIDEAADQFARILQAAAAGAEADRGRILNQLLYHLGRIIYVLDAVDDLCQDERSGAYNPLRYRYELVEGKLSPDDQAALRQSLQLSHNGVSAAFELLEENPYTGILSNTIYFGLPAVTQAVFDGTWHSEQKLHKERSSI